MEPKELKVAAIVSEMDLTIIKNLQQQISVIERMIALLRGKSTKYDWSTPIAARHSVRLICDEERMTWQEKNLICAVIQGESGFDNNATCKNTNGTTDWGICQINDNRRYWIGPGLYFKSVQEVLQNPDKAVRFMIKLYRQGLLHYWIAYKNGSYKRYMPVGMTDPKPMKKQKIVRGWAQSSINPQEVGKTVTGIIGLIAGVSVFILAHFGFTITTDQWMQNATLIGQAVASVMIAWNSIQAIIGFARKILIKEVSVPSNESTQVIDAPVPTE